MTFYHFGVQPFLSHQVPQAELPNDGLWTAPDQHVWRQTTRRTGKIPNITSAIRKVFQDKEVKPDIGEFGRIILLHGVYHELYQVRAYFQRPMSMWVPDSASQQQLQPQQYQQTLVSEVDETSPESNQSAPWLSETRVFAAWRNASLDCVDVLHWWANGVIALQSGMEHPTVFHLHFSRTVLLVPVKEIMLLITSITNQQSSYGHEQAAPSAVLEAEKEVIRWAHRDEVCHPLRAFILEEPSNISSFSSPFSPKQDLLSSTAGAYSGICVGFPLWPFTNPSLSFSRRWLSGLTAITFREVVLRETL